MGRINYSRYVYLLFLCFTILFSVIPMVLAIDLIQVKEYVAFQDILHQWYIPYSYFARVIISNLDYFDFNVLSFLKSLVSNISMINTMVLFCIVYMFAASKESFMKLYNKRWMTLMFTYISTYVLMGGIIIVGFSLTTLQSIISLFQYTAYIMVLGHLILIVLSLYYLYELNRDYQFNRKRKHSV